MMKLHYVSKGFFLRGNIVLTPEWKL